VPQSATKQGRRFAAIRPAAVILQPSGMVRILKQVAVADVVVLPADQAAKAREAFDHVGVLAEAVAVADAVVDAGRGEVDIQRIPMRLLSESCWRPERGRFRLLRLHGCERMTGLTTRRRSDKFAEFSFSSVDRPTAILHQIIPE
jgi:hypothetical protein